MLAGGLSAENVVQAAQLGCRGLDFNSGVESAPGKKDANQLQQFSNSYGIIRLSAWQHA